MLRIALWRLLAIVSVLLGLIGVVLPGLPTVPFMILAAWASGKGWPALEVWLLQHPRYGPQVLAWREYGAVPRRAKLFGISMMVISAIVLQFSPVPLWMRVGMPLFLCGVAAWLWTRPER